MVLPAAIPTYSDQTQIESNPHSERESSVPGLQGLALFQQRPPLTFISWLWGATGESKTKDTTAMMYGFPSVFCCLVWLFIKLSYFTTQSVCRAEADCGFWFRHLEWNNWRKSWMHEREKQTDKERMRPNWGEGRGGENYTCSGRGFINWAAKPCWRTASAAQCCLLRSER